MSVNTPDQFLEKPSVFSGLKHNIKHFMGCFSRNIFSLKMFKLTRHNLHNFVKYYFSTKVFKKIIQNLHEN